MYNPRQNNRACLLLTNSGNAAGDPLSPSKIISDMFIFIKVSWILFAFFVQSLLAGLWLIAFVCETAQAGAIVRLADCLSHKYCVREALVALRTDLAFPYSASTEGISLRTFLSWRGY